MAAEEYVIDVTVQAIDKTSEPLAQAQKRVSEFDRAAEQTARRLQSLSRSPFDLTVRAIDKATGTMDRIYARGLSLARKPIEIVVRAKDLATAPIKGIFDLLSSYQTYILGYVFGKVGQATIAWPLQLADNLTQASIAFQTMLHSAQKAQQFMQQVQQFAIQTPFSTEDIIKNAQFLLAMGFKYQQIIPMIQAVGDAAAAVGGNADLIERILLALGQMQAKGKVQADEMLQLTEANIPAWQFLAQAMHKSVAEVQQLASKGKLEAAPAIQAIVQGMEKLYGGQMQANANKTFSGLMSQIEDTFRISIVTRWGQGIQQAVIPALSEFNDWLGRNRTEVNRLGDAMYELGREGAQWVVDKVKAIAVSLSQLVNSREWQQATTFGQKMHLVWEDIVVAPFWSWWQSGGQQAVANIAAAMGRFLGSTLKGMILGALGLVAPEDTHVKKTVTVSLEPVQRPGIFRHLTPSDQAAYIQSFTKTLPTDPWADAGQTAGTAFLNAFLKAFDADKVANKLKEAFLRIQPSFFGGQTHTLGGDIASLLVDYWLLRLGLRGVRNVADTARGVGTVGRWIGRLLRRGGGGRGPGAGGSAAAVESAAQHAEQRMSGLVDQYGRPIPSVLAEIERVPQTGIRSRIVNALRRVGRLPGLNLLFGGLDVMTALRATTREERWGGIGSGIGSTIGSIAFGALGGAIGGPGGAMIGSYLGGVIGEYLGRGIGRDLSRVNWSEIGRGLSGALSTVRSVGGRIVNAAGDLVSGIQRHVSPLPERVRGWFGQVRDNAIDRFQSMRENAVSRAHDIAEGLRKWFEPLPGKAASWFGTMRDKSLQIFDSFRSGAGGIFGRLWGTIAGPLQSTVNGVINFLNSIIKAINWLASKFGLPNIPLISAVAIAGAGAGVSGGGGGQAIRGNGGPEIHALARGTSDWKGGLALVGEEGPELVYLPPHSSVLPAPQTKRIIPGLKTGVGTFFDKAMDVFEMLAKGPETLAHSVMQKFVQPPHLPGVFSNLGTALFKWATNGLVKWIENNLPKISFSGGGFVANSKQVAQWLTAALQATGTPLSWLPGLMRLVAAESSGNPFAINPTPVNGEHATGLLQTLPSTFREYAVKGLNNIFDPVANAAAAIQYIKARYGSVYNTPLFKGGPYVGYANGGTITEPVVGMGLHSGTGYLFGERGPEEVVPVGRTGKGATRIGRTAQVNVSLGGVSLSVSVGSGDPKHILDVLRAHAPEVARRIADAVAEEIGKRLERAHANLPVTP